MPSNFTGSMDTTLAPDMVSERPEQDVSGVISAAGENVSAFLGMWKKDNDEAKLGEFSAALADIESKAIEYQTEYASIIEAQSAVDAADTRTMTALQERLARLKAGQTQGRLSPASARLATLQQIKDISIAHPMLATKARAMANESMDNLQEVNNELFSDDPTTKAANATYEKALSLKTTPAVILEMDRNNAEAALALKTYEVQDAQKAATLGTAVSTVRMSSYSEAMARTSQWALEFYNATTSGAVVDEATITNSLGIFKDEFQRKYVPMLVGKNASPQDIESALAPAYSLFDNLSRIMTSSGATVQAKAAEAKRLVEVAAQDAEKAKAAFRSTLPGWLKFAPDNVVFDSLSAAMSVATATNAFDYRTKEGKEAWMTSATAGLVEGNPGLATALYLLDTEQGQKLVAEQASYMVYKGQGAAPTQDPVLSAAAKRELDKYLAAVKDPASRASAVDNAYPYFSWVDLANNPNMRKGVRDNPQALTHAMEKAAGYASSWLVKVDPDKVRVDHKDMQNPFKIDGEAKGTNTWYNTFQGRKPTYAELQALPVSERLNYMYLDILNSYGAGAVDTWLQELGFGATESGYNKSNSPPSPDKKKVTSERGAPPEEYAPLMSEAERKHNLPSGLISAVAWEESRYDAGAIGPKTKYGQALGIMQIMPEFHQTNPLNPKAAIDYAGGYLARLYDQFGDWRMALAAYNWGEGNVAKIANDPNWFDRLPDETKQYVTNITAG